MKSFVLGIDHSIQYLDDEHRLKAIVTQLCDEHGCDLIAEEWRSDENKQPQTVGNEVANERSVRWLNMNMPGSECERLEILPDLKRRRPALLDEISGQIAQEIRDWVYFPRADCLRENYWLQKIMESDRHASVLVLCGLIHVKPFAGKLIAAG